MELVFTYIIFLWIVGTLIISAWANRKGLGAGYFAASIFLSPMIGALLVAIAEPNRKVLAKRGKFKQCPDCAEYAQLQARKCPYCGYQFSTPTIAESSQIAASPIPHNRSNQ